ncbi:hypothetical protein FDP41_005530 [Naegleria fowleri]|uniref:Secreted protein n=1 Tax=Naegleria fowleri TaxID=5763 RepID=A0A6A5BKX8_NAEFO|nr:uncharacterized protein FDP41_005530 [Naegleria fowleri]KAF0975536.1 hypothetical protein FDP41_005530 [Naegleria fowleri]
MWGSSLLIVNFYLWLTWSCLKISFEKNTPKSHSSETITTWATKISGSLTQRTTPRVLEDARFAVTERV